MIAALRRPHLATLAAAAALIAGCGDDEGRVEQDAAGTDPSTAPSTSTGPGTTTALEGARTEPQTGETETGRGGGATAPKPGGRGKGTERQPGGAGDEIPASSQALFTGRGGRITPPVVRVPPFIAIRVQLRSADGETYSLRSGGHTLITGAGVETMSATLEGLRPGRRVVLSGPSGRVTVEASAEPGP